MIQGELEDEPVESQGRDARLHMLDQEIEHLGDQLAGAPHAGKAFRRRAA